MTWGYIITKQTESAILMAPQGPQKGISIVFAIHWNSFSPNKILCFSPQKTDQQINFSTDHRASLESNKNIQVVYYDKLLWLRNAPFLITSVALLLSSESHHANLWLLHSIVSAKKLIVVSQDEFDTVKLMSPCAMCILFCDPNLLSLSLSLSL